MADTSAAKFVGPMSLASCADVEQQSTESLLQGLLSRSPMLDSPSHNMGPLSLSPHPVSESNACRLQSGQLLSVPGASKFALAAASPVTLNVSAGRGPEKLHETDPDELTSRKPVRTPTELQLRGLSLSDASDDSRETGLVLLAPPTPVSKTAILAHRPTRNCDCRDYWPRIDEKNMSVRRAVGPGHKAPSQVRSVVCDDFLSQLVPMMPSSKGSKKVRAGNTVRSLPGDLVEVLRLGNDAQGRPTPCKPAHSRGSSCSSTPSAGPRPLTLQQLSSFGGSLASHSGTTFTKSSVSAWSPPSSASVSLDEPAQAKNVEDTLGELFRSLKSIIPDVLEACNNDGTAAFEQLQQMQDDVFNAVEWFSPPLAADVVVHSLKEKIDILAEQYNELPRGVIQEYLRRNSEDLDRASTQLLMTKDSNEDQAKVEHDRVLALELSQSSPPRNQRRSQYSEPTVDVSTMPAHSDWLTNGGEAARGRVKHLHACFPSAPQSVIEKILHISKDNLDFAKDILREEGHEEVAQRLTLHPHLSSEGRQSLGSSRTNSRSPRCNDYTRVKNHQTLYEEHRAQGNAINKNIIQKVQKVEELRRENRHNDASMLEAQIPELKRQARRADQFAKESIFENMNKDNCAMREIDLHCLHRREAIEKVHQMVEYCINDPVSDTFCKVVTGWGRGSQDNVPKLRPAVEEYLDKRGITHGLEVGNSGMVCFCINRGQRLQPYMECF